ncbi:MAG: hypothetical protein NT029_08185 [Armatimonadetes bacterium]|nr:hypothetical protein [Armatimonadota bacterium]
MTALEQLAVDYVRARGARDDARKARAKALLELSKRFETRGVARPSIDEELSIAMGKAWNRLRKAVAAMDDGAPRLDGVDGVDDGGNGQADPYAQMSMGMDGLP